MMNSAHAHLLVNHLPVFCVAFGLAALVGAMARRSDELRWAAIALFVLAGASAWIASATGESAAKIVGQLPDISKSLIERHEEAADGAMISAALLAVSAVVLAAVARFRPRFLNLAQTIPLLLALATSLLIGRAAYLGGQIHHPEIQIHSLPNPQ